MDQVGRPAYTAFVVNPDVSDGNGQLLRVLNAGLNELVDEGEWAALRDGSEDRALYAPVRTPETRLCGADLAGWVPREEARGTLKKVRRHSHGPPICMHVRAPGRDSGGSGPLSPQHGARRAQVLDAGRIVVGSEQGGWPPWVQGTWPALGALASSDDLAGLDTDIFRRTLARVAAHYNVSLTPQYLTLPFCAPHWDCSGGKPSLLGKDLKRGSVDIVAGGLLGTTVRRETSQYSCPVFVSQSVVYKGPLAPVLFADESHVRALWRPISPRTAHHRGG